MFRFGKAEFIYSNRSQKEQFSYNYDFIFSRVADGAIFDLVNAVDCGLDPIPKFPDANHMITFQYTM